VQFFKRKKRSLRVPMYVKHTILLLIPSYKILKDRQILFFS